MKLKAFCVYDSKSLSYGAPMFINSVGAALRSFGDVANDESSVICKYASDFVLYEIGEFDDDTGKLVGWDPFVNLGNASEFKRVRPVVFQPAAGDGKGEVVENK